jgi:hypothetical protein
MFKSCWEWLLPQNMGARVRARAAVAIVTCLALIVAFALLLLVWTVTGDLQVETAVAAVLLSVALLGVVALARSGRVTLANAFLVILLTVLCTLNLVAYGVSGVHAAGYFVPLVVATCGVHPLAGMVVAVLGSAVGWAAAWAASVGWYEPQIPFETYHLTFSAPALTVFLLLVAVILGVWTWNVNRVLGEPPANHS